jgi:hypothetical protein
MIPFKRDYFFIFNDLNNNTFTYNHETNGLTNVINLNTDEVLKVKKGSYVILTCSNTCEILNSNITNQKIKDLYWFIIENDMYIKALDDNTEISYQRLS